MALRIHVVPWLLLASGVLVAIGSASHVSSSQQATASAASSVTPRVAAAANALLVTLGDGERAKVSFGFDSSQRAGWSNLPEGIFHRNGLRLGDLTPPQRAAALALVAAALSREGYQKVTNIMNGDEVLKNTGRGAGPRFGLDEYYIALLGVPSAAAPWMIQFGGHHLAINVTIVGPKNVLTPSLPSAQPARYTLNGQTIRPLGHENDKGFALINALTAEQQKQAILPYQVSDLVLGPGADGKMIQPEGIVGSALTPSQQAMLLDLAHEWVGILNDDAAHAKMAEIKANLPRTYFAWSGATTNGGLMYYRIQGPTIVIEYAPQRNVDHIHTIYRDPTNDYGARLVKR
jgi:hypothetical protein